ncbi:hypothetical protein CB0940_10366 [Cercospora beticola]|nr:hypothetical protein CB0940_10366 [Cercospora beticola]PIA96215.1 hypothetical protein CB0940_10366 [Cercospora beticola]
MFCVSSAHYSCLLVASLILSLALLSLDLAMWLIPEGYPLHRGQLTAPQMRKFAVGEDINGITPQFRRKYQQYWNSSVFGPPVTRKDLSPTQVQQLLQDWGTLIPNGNGFIPVKSPKSYTLPPPLRYDEGLPQDEPFSYSMSVFHQLHCLEIILRAWLGDAIKNGHREQHPASHTQEAHVFHCFDYLRQAVMCFGDTALEGSDPYQVALGLDLWSSGTYGISTTHICKDFQQIYEYAVSHTSPSWARERSQKEADFI